MANPTTTQGESPESASRTATPGKGGELADLLNSLDNGIRITGLVLAADPPREVSGVSAKGKAYAFVTREVQIWTGSKAAMCVDRRDRIEEFPPLPLGARASFRITSVRMNGTVPVFEIDTTA